VAPTPENYNTWRTNFGRTAGGAATSLAAVPEPEGWPLIAVGMTLAITTVNTRSRAQTRLVV
jgi:hypothetical protein